MTTPRRTNPYDMIADFYDRYWTTLMPDLLAGILDRLLPDSIDAPQLADFCCGTGNLAELMLRRGFAVTGVDASAEMLARAERNAPGVTFMNDDVRTCTLPEPANVITCMFDSINHFMEESDVAEVFANVRRNLAPDGVFVFDVNDEHGFENSDGEQFSFVEDDAICILHISYTKETGRGDFDFTLMNKNDDRWDRHDLSVPERCYPVERLVDILGEAGFTGTQVLDGAVDLGIEAFTGRQFIRTWV